MVEYKYLVTQKPARCLALTDL